MVPPRLPSGRGGQHGSPVSAVISRAYLYADAEGRPPGRDAGRGGAGGPLPGQPRHKRALNTDIFTRPRASGSAEHRREPELPATAGSTPTRGSLGRPPAQLPAVGASALSNEAVGAVSALTRGGRRRGPGATGTSFNGGGAGPRRPPFKGRSKARALLTSHRERRAITVTR